MAKLNSRLGYEIKRNELALTNMMKNYDGRKQFAKRLEQVRWFTFMRYHVWR